MPGGGKRMLQVLMSRIHAQEHRFCCVIDGDGDGEAGPFTWFAGYLDAAIHEVKVSFDDAEAKPRAADTAGVAGPEKPLEKMGLLFSRNTDAAVGHLALDGPW